jgi:putative chitinase
MNNEQLKALGIDEKWLEPLNTVFDKYEINTPVRQAAFIGQCAHESANFKVLQENLNYSAEGLMKTWPSRFPTKDVADQYARQPAKIAGKENYDNCGKGIGADLIGQPDLLAQPHYAAMSAGWFWNKKGLNALADAGDIDTMTKRINGGLIGIDDRKAKIAKALQVLG